MVRCILEYNLGLLHFLNKSSFQTQPSIVKNIYAKFQFLAIQFLVVFGLSAQNLVPNYSFEDYSSCPTSQDQVYLLDDWYKPTGLSTDYFNSCFVLPSPWPVDVPDNFVGFQETITGDGYAGVVTYVAGDNIWKEYLQVLLTEPLIAGECYDVEMFSSLAEKSDWGSNGLGIYLSVTPPPIDQDGTIYLTPQFYHTDVQLDTENWVSLNGTYTAIGGEQYLTIGLFFEYGTFDVEPLIPPGNFQNLAYYYIEDVRVELNTLEEEIEVEICEGECYEYDGVQYCEEGVFEIPIEGACFSSVTLTINPAEVAIADIASPLLLNCNNIFVTLDASGSSSGNGVTYQWTGPNNFSSNQQNPVVFEPGVYTLIVEGDFLCPAETTIEVIQDLSEPNINAEVSGPLDCNNVIVVLSGSSNTLNSTFHWFGPGVDIYTQNTTTDQVGVYTLTVTGANGCSSIEEVEVVADLEIPNVFAEVSGVLGCNNSSVALLGSSTTPNVTYQWSGPSVNTDNPITSTDLPGDYTFMVIGSNGCIAVTVVNVIEENVDLDIEAVVNDTLDCINTSVTLTGSTTEPNVTYQWSGPGLLVDSSVAFVDTAGDYTLTIVTDNGGCSADTTITVMQNIETPEIIIPSPDVLNCDVTTVGIDASNSNGGGMLNFEWQDEIGNILGVDSILTTDSSGNYTLILTNVENGCADSSIVQVNQDIETPIAEAELEGLLTCENNDVSLDGSNSIGDSLSFQWLDENDELLDSVDITYVSQSGIYTLIVTNQNNGCTDSTEFEVIEDIENPIADAGSDDNLTCDDTEATLDGSNSMGENLSFQWLDENSEVVADQAISLISQAGVYTLIVTNGSNGCTATDSVIVIPDTNIPTAIIESPEELNCQNIEITLDGSNSTSVSNNSAFEWLDDLGNLISINEQIIVSTPGFYTLVITDIESGCTHSAEVEVFEDIENPIADAGPNGNLTCDDSEATLDGSNSSGNNLSYEWLDENNQFVDDQAITQVTQPGTYILIVTNGNNSCTAMSSVSVIPDANIPNAVIEIPEELNCENNEVTLDGSNSTSVSNNSAFEWLYGIGNSISINDQIIVSTPGFYTLIVTDVESGCTHFTEIEVIEDIENPIADSGPNGILTCVDSEATLDGSNSSGNNLSFEWLDENNIFVDDQAVVQVSQTGIYTLIIIDGDNGCTASAEVNVITDVNIPNAIIQFAGELNCQNTELTLDGSNSTSANNNTEFEWLDDLGNSISMNDQIVVSYPGFYTLIVTDIENGCIHSTAVEVVQNIESPLVVIDNTGPLSFDCNTSSIVLDASASSPFGNISFEWSTIDGNILSNGDAPNPEIDQTGVYILTITNLTNFCTATDSIIIVEDFDYPDAIIENPQTLTCLITEITLDASESSTIGDFTYSWTSIPLGGIISGENTLQPIINQTGIYTLIVLNNENGCTAENSINVSQDINPPIAVASVDNQFDCLTENVTLDGDGSSQGLEFNYQWTGSGIIENEFTLFPTVYQAGDYNLVVTNQQNGCTASALINVIENSNEPVGFSYEMLPPDCFASQGSIEIILVDGGEMPYLFSIDGGENFSQLASFSSLDPGNYTILVQDANGCEYEEPFTIPYINEIDVYLEPEVLLNLGDDYEINAIINFPIDEIDTIIWTPTEGLSCTDCSNPIVNSISEMTQYSVTIININGCQATDDIILRLGKTREVFIPNTFTPLNADGVNDVFMIFGNNDKIKEIYTFKIFDRWGEIVFETNHFQPNDPSKGWNGIFKNEKLNPAVFVYFTEIEFIDGVKQIYSGDVTLVD